MTTYHRTHPFSAKMIDRYALTKEGSSKSTYHVTLDVTGSGLTFKVGDSVGIYAPNDSSMVQRILTALNLDPDQQVSHPRTGNLFTLADFLTTQANLARVTATLLKQFDLPETLVTSHDLLDVALLISGRLIDLPLFLKALPPLLPRFYSVASSQLLHPNHIDLLVSLTSFEHSGEMRYGVASHFLCRQADLNSTSIPCYIQPTTHFTLPERHDAPIIMVGPGTGVAPFRAFLQERLHLSASGKNWLFFGERNQTTDFFYEEFWTALQSQNRLHLDLAFSRDQAHKIYVQHKLLEKGADIWAWLEEGALFYVCGDADPMAKEVESAILQICSAHGRLSTDEAKAYLKKLRHDKKYLADVY